MRNKEGTSLKPDERVAIHSKKWCRHIQRLKPTFASWTNQLLPAPRRGRGRLASGGYSLGEKLEGMWNISSIITSPLKNSQTLRFQLLDTKAPIWYKKFDPKYPHFRDIRGQILNFDLLFLKIWSSDFPQILTQCSPIRPVTCENFSKKYLRDFEISRF